MKHVILDADGVLVDFIGTVISYARQVTGRDHKREHVTAWGFANCLGLSPDERRSVYAAISSPGFALRTPIYAANVAVARHCIDEGYRVTILTSSWQSSPTWDHDRRRMFARALPGASVVFADAKDAWTGDVFVDDKPEHVRAWQGANPSGRAYLMNRDHNQHARDLDAVRILTLTEILREL